MWSLIYGLLTLGVHSLTMIHIERLHENYSSSLELVYLNSFNCLCLFLVADLVSPLISSPVERLNIPIKTESLLYLSLSI